MIENHEFLFCWDGIPAEDKQKFRNYIEYNYGIDWISKADIEKIDDTKIIASFEANSIELRLNREKTRLILEIDNNEVDEFIVEREYGEPNIYKLNIYRPVSKYLRYLPSLFHGALLDEKNQKIAFIERYLGIFEKIMGRMEKSELQEQKGIEEMLDVLKDLFHPRFSFLHTDDSFLPPIDHQKTEAFKRYFSAEMEEFLEWLASWMGLILKREWEIDKKREVIARILPIYKKRGTKKGLEEYLQLLEEINVNINDEGFIIGKSSKVGKDTVICGPYFFSVEVKLAMSEFESIKNKKKRLEKIINEEKPAHTDYLLRITPIKNI